VKYVVASVRRPKQQTGPNLKNEFIALHHLRSSLMESILVNDDMMAESKYKSNIPMRTHNTKSKF
jgi:hypothetical protein